MTNGQADKEAEDQKRAALEKLGRDWMERIEASKTYEKDWIDNASDAEKAYLAEDNSAPEYNILHSNVETIVPAIYNSTPAPDIRPRHANRDPISKVVCDIFEGAISTQIDDERLDAEVEALAQDAFLAGRGIIRIKYEADMQDQILKGERVVYENVSWRDYREGQAKRWADVPWVAFRHHVFQDELEQMRGSEISTIASEQDGDDSDSKGGVDIWQIWDKERRQVISVTADNSEVIKIVPDPLGLPGFFPNPQPVQPITASGKRRPVCPYTIYKTLAEELDTQTRRINAITKGLKVRGLFAGEADIMATLADAKDNEIIHMPDLAGMGATIKLDDAISWWPIDKAITVLRELVTQREQTKQAIYEITGISDIVRGASKSTETATAQQIKTQWGSLRIKRMQNLIARNVRDLFIMTADVMARNFEVSSIIKASGVQIQPEMQEQVIPMLKQIDHYRIDIESDSTVRADLTQKRGEMSEFLNGTAQFLGTMAPLVQQSPKTAEPIIEIYAAFARQFSLGKQAEAAIDKMSLMAQETAAQPQQPPKPDPVKEKELEIKSREVGVKEQGVQIDGFRAQSDVQHKRAEIMLEAQQQRPVGIG
ncbi:hypothetical protein JQV19_08445 [Sulfitobacter mediterraneus]|uniref:hypothetical protein n=1 Tax=Sulfitobacter mediterraneus TaxID=83219 RepID=UPI00193A6CA3|nr:hypothetical protein [Sulfitobacter mediterraneus]MBM1556675.1 hypothetical protein [Sulfitobacter mediterraneus]MBM1570128.1 hypothetical protein [Sulfitobacter mediterraneus]MBM1574085.1 hypothetical protein [Sulfitobacter mediterraneus]MBM1577870.1 hypothetical protein [Sulfitobacter mediterraneus]MBM1579633.1 hypothetical protein [Sulfitobacter mediterraneus]